MITLLFLIFLSTPRLLQLFSQTFSILYKEYTHLCIQPSGDVKINSIIMMIYFIDNKLINITTTLDIWIDFKKMKKLIGISRNT